MVSTDAIVIGAGPAGCSAAYWLARRGVAVALLDRRDFPRDKACGDGLSPGALEQLACIGLSGLDYLGQRISRTCVYSPEGSRVEYAVPVPGATLPRQILDAALLQQATHAGARFFPCREFVRRHLLQDGIIVETRNGERFKARCIICAIGCSRAARTAAGFPPRRPQAFGLRAYFDKVTAPEDAIVICYETALTPGYGWIFPLGKGRANVGIWTNRAPRSDAMSLFRQFVEGSLTARPFLTGAVRTSEVRGAPLAVGLVGGSGLAGRALAVGDAFFAANPLSGEGIYAALLTGRLAADAVAEALRDGNFREDALKRYQEAVHVALGGKWRRAALVARLFGSRLILNWLIAAGARFPGLSQIAAATMAEQGRRAQRRRPSSLVGILAGDFSS